MDSYLQRLQEAIASATNGMTAIDLTRHPEGKWNIAEILEHLYLSYHGTVRGLERCLHEDHSLATAITPRQWISALVVTGFGFLPEGRKAPERTVPRGMAAEQVILAVDGEIRVMDDALAKCESKFGKNTRLLAHPVLGPMTAKQWRKFHWVHGRHHVRQITELRRTLGPPLEK